MDLIIRPQIYEACPECGGQPGIQKAFYGQAYFVACESCGWEDSTRDIEVSSESALWHWEHKITRHNHRPVNLI